MTTDNRYNGWTNYETWNVKLWMDNEESSCSYWNEVAQELYDDAEPDEVFSQRERAAIDLADRLREEHESAMPELTGTYADLLGAALTSVNWDEIARNMVDEIADEERYAD
jgi:hypothetical protein